MYETDHADIVTCNADIPSSVDCIKGSGKVYHEILNEFCIIIMSDRYTGLSLK